MIGTGAGSRITIGNCIAKTFHGDRGKAAFTKCRGTVMTKKKELVHIGVCQCGCGAMFLANYTTRKPKYVNRKHRDRARRGRATARALAADFCNSQGIDPTGYRDEIQMTEIVLAYKWYFEKMQDRNWHLHCKDAAAALNKENKRMITIDNTVDMLKKLKDVIDTHGAEQIVHAPSFRAIDYVEAAVIVNLRQVDRVIDLLEAYRDEF
jgi:hypothetical protein